MAKRFAIVFDDSTRNDVLGVLVKKLELDKVPWVSDALGRLTGKDFDVFIAFCVNIRRILSLKPGDKVITVERYAVRVDDEVEVREYEHVSEVVRVESNYVETKYERSYNPEWHRADGSLIFERAYHMTWVKNYFDPNGEINIRSLK